MKRTSNKPTKKASDVTVPVKVCFYGPTNLKQTTNKLLLLCLTDFYARTNRCH